MRRFVKTAAAALGVLIVVTAMADHAAAAIVSTVPEIDASVVPAAMGLIAAGVLMLRARRKSK